MVTYYQTGAKLGRYKLLIDQADHFIMERQIVYHYKPFSKREACLGSRKQLLLSMSKMIPTAVVLLLIWLRYDDDNDDDNYEDDNDDDDDDDNDDDESMNIVILSSYDILIINGKRMLIYLLSELTLTYY